MDEFTLIRRHFATLSPPREDVSLGIGDDAALLAIPPGEELVVTSDMLIAGRHFPAETAPADIGWKALAVNLSDLAAMGAQARWFTLALSLPEVDEQWLVEFTR
ncbi:thiamine-phosphate kinase, partial [Hydrocarboniphaga sp.]